MLEGGEYILDFALAIRGGDSASDSSETANSLVNPLTWFDLDGAWLAVAAAPPEVNRAVAAAAEERRVFVNAVDDASAASVYTAGVLACEEWPRGLGLALKIEDGEDRRARSTIVIESLRQLGVLDENALEALAPYSSFPVKNHRGEIVGEIRPSFELTPA